MSSVNPTRVLKDVQAQLPGVLFLTGGRSREAVTVTLGDEQAFVQLCQRVSAPVVFIERFILEPSHFLHQGDTVVWPRPNPVDLTDAVPLQPFRRRLGELVLLVLSVPHGGVLVELDLQPDWWEAFEEAKAQALETHRGRAAVEAEVQRREQDARWERERQLLRVLLPEDTEFRRLACESSPRITALRQQAGVVLSGVVPGASINAAHDETIRLVAAKIKEEVRAARRR